MQAWLARSTVVVVILLVVACEESATSTTKSVEHDDLVRANVVRVVDGDTLTVEIDGAESRLRYIGIDAPESVTPDQPVECFGPEAAEENRRLVAGKTVFLESDVSELDRFNRLLRYVYVNGPDDGLQFVNLALVQGGFAEAGSFPPDERYRDELFAAERDAEEHGRGLWGACR